MSKFIEVTVNGDKQLVNISHIIRVYKSYCGNCVIETTANIESEHHLIGVDEPYEQVKKMIMERE